MVWLPCSALIAVTASAWLLNLTNAQPTDDVQHIITHRRIARGGTKEHDFSTWGRMRLCSTNRIHQCYL